MDAKFVLCISTIIYCTNTVHVQIKIPCVSRKQMSEPGIGRINSPWYPGTGGCPIIDSNKLPGDGENKNSSIAKSRATPKNLILPTESEPRSILTLRVWLKNIN